MNAPKHRLLHRLRRFWRFTNHERVDTLAVQTAFVPHTVAQLGFPRLLGLAIDWTMFDTTLPSGGRRPYQVLRIAGPRKGRALPLLQLAYDRDHLPAERSQNQLEQDALLAVVEALPAGVRPVILAARGFCRAGFLTWLEYRGLDYVVRLSKGACITEPDGRRWKLGEDGLRAGRAALGAQCPLWSASRSSPRALRQRGAVLKVAQEPGEGAPTREAPGAMVPGREPEGPEECGQLVLDEGLDRAVLKDCKSRFGLSRARMRCPKRLSRLLIQFRFFSPFDEYASGTVTT